MIRLVLSTCLAAFAVTIAAAPVSAGQAHHIRSAKCGPRLGKVIAADNLAQVYVTHESDSNDLVLRACYIGANRSYELGSYLSEQVCSSQGCPPIATHETLTGSLLAYEVSSSGIENFTYLVVVRNLRNGRILHKVPTGVPYPPHPLIVGNGPASSIVLKSNGSVAWITADSVGETTLYEVHALDKIGNRLLATGTDIDPHSLALAGSTLYWTEGSKPFSTGLN